MSSVSNAIDEWSTRSTSGISALRHQLISGDFSDRLTSVNTMAAIVDSAYSSFSGSSYVADYQTAFKPDICHLNNEQMSYMDSEYVKAIYNPSVIEQNHLQQRPHCDDSKEDAGSGPEDQFSHKTKRSPTSNSSLCLPEHKISRRQGHCPPWLRNSVQSKLSHSSAFSSNMEGDSQPHFISSTFLAHSEDMMSHSEVSNEIYHNSQTDKSSKEGFKGIDIHIVKPYSLEGEEHTHNNYFDSSLDDAHKEGNTSKSTRRSWNEFVSEKLRGYKKKVGSWKPAKDTNCYEGTKSEDLEKLALNQQREQYRLPTQNMMDVECDNIGKCDIKYKHTHTNSQTVYGVHSDNLYDQPLKLLNHDDLHDLARDHSIRKDATIKLIPLLSQKQEARPQISNFCDLPSEKITKTSTPMLYHLAGCNSSLAMMNTLKQSKQVDSSKESGTFQNKSLISVSRVAEPQQPLHKTNGQSKLDENLGNELSDCDTAEDVSYSAEESMMLDYREKLKIAQKKVLRETSFKRRDLQMSLPVRLKLNPPKRPSVDHIRSYSLSSSNEDTKFAKSNISIDKGHKKNESEKTSVLRIGGRKRLTKEQRKLCYSEPEKLDHLGIHNSGMAWNSDASVQNKSGNHYRMKSLDKERTLSSSNISKTELKQIQHNALVEYMERKANQRPSSFHQSNVQKTLGAQFSEWKSVTIETPCSDESLIYHHRRSTGASSSYDATVTWNDRYLKVSFLGEQAHSGDAMREKSTSFDQCTLDTSEGDSKESSTSICQERFKNTAGHVAFSTTALQSNGNACKNRLCVMGENAASETEKAFKARSRGKSMEELGTSDKTRLSVLSQSSDQIYHIKVATLIPLPESASGTAVVHQDKLKASAHHESGKQPRQTSHEDFPEPHGSDVGESTQEIHSRSQRTSVVSSDNSSSTPRSQFYPMATEISPRQQVGDEIFSCMQQEQNIHYTSEDNSLSQGALAVLHSPPIASLDPSDEYLPGYDNEVRADVNDLCGSSVVGEPPILTVEDQDTEAVTKQIKSTDFQSMSSIQQEELDLHSTSQVIGIQSASSAGNDEYSQSHGSTRPEMDATKEERRESSREDLTGITIQPPAEERCAELVKEIVSKDKSLVDILKPLPVRASAVSLMKSLFHVDISLLEECRNRGQKKDNRVNVEGMSKSHLKTMLLLQSKSDVCLDEITSKKMELMSNISSQLEVLFIQRESLLSEISNNTTHGINMEAIVKEVCKPNEYERYMMFIGDLEKVVSLLFCLTTRLARVENALSRADENTEADEMQSLKERHSLLSRQREDAKDLKDNLDRREQVVTGILAKYLNEAQLEDYKHYVRLKTYFLIEQKDLEEKIKFHEEQLESLHNSIPP